MESTFEDGYDTEEEIGPFWDATHREGPQDPKEITLDTLLPSKATTNKAKTNGEGGGNGDNGGINQQGSTKITTTTTTMEKISSLKGKWIGTKLKLRLLSTYGNKAVKAKRLLDGWAIRRFNTEEDATAAKKKWPKKKRVITGLKIFPSSAK